MLNVLYATGRRLRLPLLLGVLLALLAPGCRRAPTAGNGSGGGGGLTLRIGHQKADALNLLMLRGDLERRLAGRGVKVEWLEFPAGPPLLEALSVGSLDLGSTGESPPLFAQAAGGSLVYVANIPLTTDPGKGHALLVRRDSPLRAVTDLKGKRIAVAKASGAHNFLIQLVEKAGLQYSDIQPAFLSPPDARVAFEAGSVDGWAIWEPYLTVAQQKTGARVLADGRDEVTPGSFYLASRDFARAHSDLIKILIEELDRTGDWATNHQREAAQLLAGNTGIDVATLELLLSKQSRIHIRRIDETIIREQQTIADNYFRIGLLPRKLNVREAMLTSGEYALLTPETPSASAR
jgi:sulfonate transport system substrate-binding protein